MTMAGEQQKKRRDWEKNCAHKGKTEDREWMSGKCILILMAK
jgi:hypothetical protein